LTCNFIQFNQRGLHNRSYYPLLKISSSISKNPPMRVEK